MVSTSQRFGLVLAFLWSDLAGATNLSGRVVDSQEQRVFADAVVTLTPDGGAQVRTDRDGFFRLDGVAPGGQLLGITLPDGSRFGVRLLVPAQAAVFFELDRARHTPPDHDDEY